MFPELSGQRLGSAAADPERSAHRHRKDPKGHPPKVVNLPLPREQVRHTHSSSSLAAFYLSFRGHVGTEAEMVFGPIIYQRPICI